MCNSSPKGRCSFDKKERKKNSNLVPQATKAIRLSFESHEEVMGLVCFEISWEKVEASSFQQVTKAKRHGVLALFKYSFAVISMKEARAQQVMDSQCNLIVKQLRL